MTLNLADLEAQLRLINEKDWKKEHDVIKTCIQAIKEARAVIGYYDKHPAGAKSEFRRRMSLWMFNFGCDK